MTQDPLDPLDLPGQLARQVRKVTLDLLALSAQLAQRGLQAGLALPGLQGPWGPQVLRDQLARLGLSSEPPPSSQTEEDS